MIKLSPTATWGLVIALTVVVATIAVITAIGNYTRPTPQAVMSVVPCAPGYHLALMGGTSQCVK